MIKTGAKYLTEKVVTEEMTAVRAGSGTLRVLGTPFMVGMMENAALLCLQPFLEDGKGSVGIRLNVSHDAPTPVGMRVWAEAEITHVSENGRIVDFRVSARDEAGVIGSGTHSRAVIQNDRFLSKCYAKLDGKEEN